MIIKDEIIQLTKYLSSFLRGIDKDLYVEQLNILYGALVELKAWSPSIIDEIADIERDRYQKQGVAIEKAHQCVLVDDGVFVYCILFSKS